MSEIIRSKQLTASVLLAASIGALGLTSCSWKESDSSQQPPVETELPSPAVTELPADSPEDDESEQSPDSPADPAEETKAPDVYKDIPEVIPLPVGPDESIEDAIPMPNDGNKGMQPKQLTFNTLSANFRNALTPEYPNGRSELIHSLETGLAAYDEDPSISHEDIEDQIEQIQEINQLAFEEVNISESPNIFTQFEEYYESKVNVSFGAAKEGKRNFVIFNASNDIVMISHEFRVNNTWYTITSTYNININPVSLYQALRKGEKPDKIMVNAMPNEDYEPLIWKPYLLNMVGSPEDDSWIAATEAITRGPFSEVVDLPFVGAEKAKNILTKVVHLANQ